MTTIHAFAIVLLLAFTASPAHSQTAPVVSNVVGVQRAATPLVDITYDLAAVAPGKIILEISSDGGATWVVPVDTVSGAIGSGVTPGLGRSIIWDAGTDYPESYSSQMRFRLTVDDGYALIPSGSFVMGATSGDSDANAPPVTVTVSDFYLQETETTKAQWDDVRAWGLNNGYTDLAVGGGKASNHPVQMVSWWDVVKWCNARSEKEGLTPCYTVDSSVMRTGTVAPICNWSTNGYRLPSEAEWEKAARGGVSGQRFPWGDTITHSEANYSSSSSYSYDVSPTRGSHPSYATGATPYTSQVGSFTANSYGLYDMIGNVEEWCWDWYGGSYYQNGAADPQGPATSNNRVMRGGSHSLTANFERSSNRTTNPPGTPSSGAGIRPARSIITAITNSVTTALAPVDTRSTNFNPPVVVDPYAAPFNLPSSSSNGTPLTYAVVAGATIANVTDNTVTLTGQNGPVTMRATGAGLEDQYLTFRVESSPNWKKVFTGTGAPGNYTYGLKEDGSIWSWGANVSQNLGVAGLGFRRRPLQMGTDSDWADLSAGELGFCFAAIKTDGRLFTWGSNNAGQLGVGTTTNSFTPVLVDGSTDWKQAVVGSNHMIALKQEGSLWAWGINVNGRLGDGTTVNKSIPIRIGTDVDWMFVAAGNAASYAIKNDGSLWAWGYNGNGRLGDGTTTDRLVPTRIGVATDWLTVDGGNTHAMALKTDGSLWTWGANASGQIGNGTTTNQLTPVQLSPGQTWSKIYAGKDNSMAIRSNGTLWAWGSNTLGQLGDGTMSNQLYPVQVGYHHDWKEIACAVHSAGIKEDGRMWSWGTDDDGELGNTSWWHNPIGGAATNVSSFSTGLSVTAFIRKDGSLWILGTNSNLCLGLGLSSTLAQQWEPARIGTANNWVSVTAGENHVLALKRDGTIWAWGRNTEGQLGVANTVNQSTPVQVGTDSDWVFVEGGTNHSLAIKADGSLWSWGVNTNGQLGIGTLNSSSIPVRVGLLNDWKIVSAAYHNLALKKDGSIWAWGMNNQTNGGGQIGNNTTTDVLSPVRVGTETDWAQVQAGGAHSLALKTTGSLWGWGSNVWGEIDQATRSTPGRIGTATDWKTISAGNQLTIALKVDSAVWTSGNNFGGRLGLGVGASRNMYSVLTSTRLGLANAYKGIPDGGMASGRNVLLTKSGDLWAAGTASSANVGTHKRKLGPQIVFADLEQQTLSFGQNGNLQVGQSLSLAASSTSGLPIQYSIAGNGVISGNVLTATAPGKIEVVGWQAGDEVWDITPPMAITIDVSKATQEINFATIPDKLTTDSVNLTAVGGGSNNPVTFVVTSGPAVITNNVLTFTNAGSVTITASQAGNDNYLAAPDVSNTFMAGSAQIATQPQPSTTEQNGSATLSVVATGVGTLVYQWQKDGVDLPGATNATLMIPAFKPWHVGSYRVRVSDSLDKAWSNTAQLSLNATQPASLWQDLLLFLPFAGNTTDFSTSARTITQINVGVGNSPAGTPNGSASFNGSSSRMDFNPNLPDLTEMTISLWIRPTTTNHYAHLFSDWDDALGKDVYLIYDNGRIHVRAKADLGWTSEPFMTASNWYHITWVMGAAASKLYVNGQLFATVNQAGSNVGYKLRSNIGYFNYGSGGDFFAGELAAMRIYGRALTESEAVQLYRYDAPMPEIELEQPTGTALVDGSATYTWQALPTGGAASPVTYVIRNVGEANLLNLGLVKSGTNTVDFSISSLASTTLSPGRSTSFTVTFAPAAGASGTRSATLQVASNDADENPFDIALSGTAYSTTLDVDSDGMNDWGEFKLSTLGFDWQVPNSALVSAYYDNAGAAGLYNQTLYNANRTAGQNDVINSPNAYSLYTLSQVQNLNVGVPLLQRNSATGEFTLTIGVDQSTNLTSWTPLPMTVPQTVINSQGKVEFRFTAPNNAAFFRLQTQPTP